LVTDDGPGFIPSDDEEKCPGFLPYYDDDGFEPLSMVPPQGRKGRAKKRPYRIWYDDRRLQAHEQLSLHMFFINVEQFRDALINLHIAESRNFHYHENSNVRIIVDCLKKACPFYMTTSEIKEDKNFFFSPRTIASPVRRTTTKSKYEAGYPAYKKTRTWGEAMSSTS
jgi:hypothetical protein